MQVSVCFEQEDLVGVGESIEVFELGSIRSRWFFENDVFLRTLCCCVGSEELSCLLVVKRVRRGNVDDMDSWVTGEIIDGGVCVRSGNAMFGGKGFSGVAVARVNGR